MQRRASLRQRFVDPLFEQVDASSLAFFRVAFGLIMLVECWRFWSKGWIERYYIEPEFFFKYYGFEWVEPWPGSGMLWHFALLALLSLLVTLGLFYRCAAILLFFAFSYVFLLDQARYLNHFYLVMLIAVNLMLVPANRFALDAALWPRPAQRHRPGLVGVAVPPAVRGDVTLRRHREDQPDWLRLERWGCGWRGATHAAGRRTVQRGWVVAVASYGAIGVNSSAPRAAVATHARRVMAIYSCSIWRIIPVPDRHLPVGGDGRDAAVPGARLAAPRAAWVRQGAARALGRGTVAARD